MNVKKYTFLSYLVLLQYFFYFNYFSTRDYAFLAIYFLFSLLISITIIVLEKINIKLIILIISTVLLFIIFSILSPEADVLLDLYNLLYGIISIASAYVLYKNNNVYKWISIVFWVYFAYILYYVLIFGVEMGAYNNIFANSSRNYVSAIFLFISILFYISCYKVKKHIPLIYPLITFLATIILAGRSGLILSLAILVYFVLIYSKVKYRKYIISCIIISAIFYYNSFIIDFMETNTSFNQGLDSPRHVKNNEYMRNIYNDFNFIIGQSIDECCSTIVKYERNPHNSFIMGHLRYGLIHTIFMLLSFFYVTITKNLFLIVMISILYIRAFLDTILFFTAFDIVFFYLLFITHSLNINKRI